MFCFRLVAKLCFVGFEEFCYAVIVQVVRGVDKSVVDFGVLGLVPEIQLREEMVKVEFFVRFQEFPARGVQAHKDVLNITGHQDELSGHLWHINKPINLAA